MIDAALKCIEENCEELNRNVVDANDAEEDLWRRNSLMPIGEKKNDEKMKETKKNKRSETSLTL